MYNYQCLSDINNLILQVKYGCKKELLNLVQIKGIGRVRARSLFNEGFLTINDLRDVPIKRLAKIKTIGDSIAKSIKDQIGEKSKDSNMDLSEFD
jgi:helicase